MHRCRQIYVIKVIFRKFKSYFFFVCLGFFAPQSRIFNSYRDVPLPVKGYNFLFTYTRHSWPLSSEGSFTYHTYCDTGQPFIMVISEDPWHSHLLPSVWKRSCHCMCKRLMSVPTSQPGIEPRFPACETNALPQRLRGGQVIIR